MMSPFRVLAFVYRKKWTLLWIVAIALIAGEIHLRTKWGRRLEYQPDPVLGAVLHPDQASLSTTINSMGHRGNETDPTKPVIVSVGDSQAWGSGVEDHEVWTRKLEAQLHQDRNVPEDIQIVNAAHPGHGPYHQYVRLSRALAFPDIRLVLVRVSIEDRNFVPLSEAQRKKMYQLSEKRQTIRKVTKVLPKLFKRVKGSLKKVLPEQSSGLSSSSPRNPEAGARMWEKNHEWWERMLALAESRQIPIVFYLHDPLDHPSTAVLEKNLRKLTHGHKLADVVRFGTKEFQVKSSADYRERFTLGHDPHGNSAQHQLIADLMYKHLTWSDRLDPYRFAARKSSAGSNGPIKVTTRKVSGE